MDRGIGCGHIILGVFLCNKKGFNGYFDVYFSSISADNIERYSYSRFRLLADFIKKDLIPELCKRTYGGNIQIFKSGRCNFVMRWVVCDTDLQRQRGSGVSQYFRLGICRNGMGKLLYNKAVLRI